MKDAVLKRKSEFWKCLCMTQCLAGINVWHMTLWVGVEHLHYDPILFERGLNTQHMILWSMRVKHLDYDSVFEQELNAHHIIMWVGVEHLNHDPI